MAGADPWDEPMMSNGDDDPPPVASPPPPGLEPPRLSLPGGIGWGNGGPPQASIEPPLCEDQSIPAFPWPVPQPSDLVTLLNIRSNAGIGSTLGSVQTVIQETLDQAGYSRLAYFEVPGGFAMVARLERTDENGRPLSGDARWQQTVQMTEFSLAAYFRILFSSEPGHFRVVSFVVTDQAVVPSGAAPDSATATGWLGDGAISLGCTISERPFTARHNVVALVYEFEKAGDNEDAVYHDPGLVRARDHLARTSLQSGAASLASSPASIWDRLNTDGRP